MGVRTHPEEDHVEEVWSVGGKGLGVCRSAGVRRRGGARSGDPVDVRRVKGECVEERGTVLGLVAVRVADGEVTLVAPPQVDDRPVDCAGEAQAVDGGEEGRSHRATGEHDMGHATRGDRVPDREDESRPDRGGEGVAVGVGDHRERHDGAELSAAGSSVTN